MTARPGGSAAEGPLVPAAVWRTTPELLVALDDRFGEPVDCYVNGSQVWLRDDGPAGAVLEWRLHPVGGYERPAGVTTYDVFSRTALALAQGEPPPAPLSRLWDGLECFAAYDDEIEPAVLVRCAVETLGIPPDASGLVDHEGIAQRWQASGRRSSIVAELLTELARRPEPEAEP